MAPCLEARADSLSLFEPPVDRWVVQRHRSQPGEAYLGSFEVGGQYQGTPGAIEVRAIDAETGAAVTPFSPVDAAPAGGSWHGRLENIPQGGWYRLEARFAAAPAVAAASEQRFGVGTIVAAIGQSNMVKHFTEDEADGSLPPPFALPHPLGRRLGYGEPPPYLYARPRAAEIPVSWGEPTGTGGIRLVNQLVAELGVPVLVLDFALDWTSLEGDWTDAGWVGWTRFAAALAQVGKIEAVLWHQGAVDAQEPGTLAADYKAGLDLLYSRITGITGGHGSLPLVLSVQNRGVYDDVLYKDEGYNQVRRAQLEYIGERPWAFAAGSSIDLELSSQPYAGDGHFRAAGYQLMADRYCRGILNAIGHPGFERGLRGGAIAAASQHGSEVHIEVAHDQGSRLTLRDPAAMVEGFTLTDGAWEVGQGASLARHELAIAEARLADGEDGNWVVLKLAAPPAGPLRLRYLYGQNVFHAKSTAAARRAGGNLLYDDFTYHPERSGLPINGTTADVAVEPVAGLVLGSAAPLVVPEGGNAALPVHLSAAPAGSVTVTAQLFGDSDLTLAGPSSLTFGPANWQVDQSFELAAAADADSANGAGHLRLAAPGHQKKAVTLEELDSSPALVPGAASIALSVFGGAASLALHLSRAPLSEVVVKAAGVPGRLGATPAELSFTPANWQNDQQLTLAGLGGEAGPASLLLAVDSAFSDGAWAAVAASVEVDLLGPDSLLLVHLPLDETSGAVAYDLSGQAHHATLGADVVPGGSGVFGHSAATTAPGGAAGTPADGLVLANFAAGDAYLELSAALWYRLPASPHDGYLFHWGGTYETPNAVSAFLDAGTGIRVRVHDAADTGSVLLVAPAGFDDDGWHHLAITKGPLGIAVYFDGQPAGSSAAIGRGSLAPAGGAALGLNESGKYGVAAQLDDFRLWARRLTAGDVASLYAAGASGSLEVFLEPAAARAAGAVWRLAAGPDTAWHASGEAVHGLPPGSYQLLLADLADWARPAPQPILVAGGSQDTLATYQSLPPGSARVHLSLDETSGSVAGDLSGHHNSGAYGAAVTLGQSGVAAAGARTAGPGSSAGSPADAVSISGLLAGTPLAELSVAFWYRLPAGAHDGYLFSWGGSNSAANHVSAFLDVGTGLRVRVHPAGDTSSVLVASPPGFDNGAWHHLAIVKDGGGSRLYLDGALVKSAVTGAAAVTTNGLFRLGTNETGAYGIAATFDEVRVYGRALAAAEVVGLQATPAAGQLTVQLEPAAVAGLGARWRLDSGGDTGWHSSGATVSLPSGVYTVEAEEAAPWQRPASEAVTVSPGAAAALTLVYSSLVATPILRLGFDETAGAVASDLSGGGRHGVYGVRVSRGLGGVAGRAVQTAGVGASLGSLADGIRIPALAGATSYQQASVAFWYRLPAEPHDGYLFGWGGTHSAANSISLFFDAGVGLRARVHGGADSSSVVQVAPAGFENTAWHHLAVVKEAAGSRLYFDGQQVYSGGMGGGFFKPGLGFFLGTNQIGTFGVEASFDELAVFDRALSGEQVLELYGAGGPPASFGGDYRTAGEIEAALYAAAAAHPELVAVLDYGDSFAKTQGGLLTPDGDPLAGHDLLVARVGRGALPQPALILTGCLHPREIVTAELVLRFLDWLIAGDGVDAEATWLLDHHQIYLAPLTNPDGHDLVELGSLAEHGARPFRWRKNARPLAGCPWPPTDAGAGSGVDLNRNFPFAWGQSNDRAGSSTPCDPYYRGPAAASEPETQALAELVRSLVADQRGPGLADAAPDDATGIFVQLHSPYRTVGWPWSHDAAAAPNGADLAEIGRQLASYAGYQAGQVGAELYEMTGTAESWVYGELGAAAFLIEVGEGLMPAYGRVDNVLWPEIRDSLVYAAKIARAPYLLSRGPLVSQPSAVFAGGGLQVAARARDAQGDPVVAAELYFDLPPWSPGAAAWALDAEDGVFGESEEDLRGDPGPALAPGRHLLFLRARDGGGNWGPVSAVFVTVP